jgi:hypothetical protein
MDQILAPARAGLGTLKRRSLAVGVVGFAALAAGGLANADQFLHSYLPAYLFWLGLGSGSLALLMTYHLTGGAWGAVTRRVFEAATRTLPLMAVLFIPLALGVSRLYLWTNRAAVVADPVLSEKAGYLNVPFFLARAAIYFAVWLVLMYLLNRWSRAQDRTGDPAFEDHLRRLSAVGVILWGLAVTFAAVDWVMSLDPRYFSTIFGILLIGAHGLGAMAFAILVVFLLWRRGALGNVFTPGYLLDLGNLLLAFVILYAYFAYSQLIITWAGNLPEEIRWYLPRIEGGWKMIAIFLVLFHFFVPFFLLLFRRTKWRFAALASVTVVILVARLVDTFFLVGPNFYPQLQVHWMDLAALVGIGGIWLGVFAWQLEAWPLLPQHDHELEIALARVRTQAGVRT